MRMDTAGGVREAKSVARLLFREAKVRGAWGFSAPQFGILSRMFLMCTPLETVQSDEDSWLKRQPLEYPGYEGVKLPPFASPVRHTLERPMHYTPIINPAIMSVSDEVDADYEQCTSIPGIACLVPRHTWIVATFTTLDHQKHTLHLSGHPARLFQHEFDHLEGIIMVDRMYNTSDLIASAELHNFEHTDDNDTQRDFYRT